MKKVILTSIALTALIAFTPGCSSKRTVERVNENEQIDLSGRWNDTDSKLAAEELTDEALTGKWLKEFVSANSGSRPVVIIGFIENKSHEHIEPETFIKDMEKAFINTGKVDLVQGGDKRAEIRAERADQQNYSSNSTMKKWGLEMGADFMMQGSINSIVDQYKKEKVVYYQIDLELTNMETNQIVWIGDKKIKKYIKN